MRAWHKKGTHPTNHTEPHLSAQDAEEESKGEDQDKKRNDAEKERAILHGIVEKKTYIGLVSFISWIDATADSFCTGPSICCGDETQSSRRKGTILFRLVQLNCVSTEVCQLLFAYYCSAEL
jgi:hypothetical protein